MNNIYYLDDECLNHLDAEKKIKSLLWKFLYKRVQKRLKKSTITIENIKKIIFNKHNSIGCDIDSFAVMFRNEAVWYCIDEKDYYLPLSIGFADKYSYYSIVLINGEIDLRIKHKNIKEDKLSHTPILFLKTFDMIEKSFINLLNQIEKEDLKKHNI